MKCADLNRVIPKVGGTDLTVGKHPMYNRRVELRQSNILSAQYPSAQRVCPRRRLRHRAAGGAGTARDSSSFRWRTRQADVIIVDRMMWLW